ncbi:MAG: FCD domain-containing protein [Methylobacterium frigidaeris]
MVGTRKSLGETRAGDVLQRLRLDIVSCVLKPGSRLRFESLKVMYAVSFSTLREALSRLVAEGLVIAEGQRGFVVAPLSLADLQDLTDVRVLIEREALRLAIGRGDDGWEATVLGAYHRMSRLQDRLGAEYYLSDEWATLHGDFHFALVSACASPNLIEIRHKLYHQAHRYRRMSSQFRRKWREKDVEHRTLMEAVLARDPERSASLIERHIRETTENLVNCAGHLFEPEASAGRGGAVAAE